MFTNMGLVKQITVETLQLESLKNKETGIKSVYLA